MGKTNSKKKNSLILHFFTTKLFLVILLCLFLLITILVSYQNKIQNTKQLISETETAIVSTIRASEIRYQALDNTINQLNYLDTLKTNTSWMSDVQFLESSFNEIEYIAWIDKDFSIKTVVPIDNNESILYKNANLIKSSPSTIKLWFPAYDGNIFKGFNLSSIDITKLIKPYEKTFLNGFMIQIQKNGEIIYNSSNWEKPNPSFMLDRTLLLEDDVEISISCAPTKASIQSIQFSFYSTISIFLLITVLTLLTVFFAQKFYFVSKLNALRYRKLLDDANLLAIILNTEGTITYCNDYFLNLTGWTRKEIIGTNFYEKFSTPDKSEYYQTFLKSAKEGDLPFHIEFILITKKGETRWIHFNNTLQRNVKGNIIGFSSLGEDITEQKKSEESLKKQYEFLKTLFSIDSSITARDNIYKIFDYILNEVNLKLGSKATSILLFNEKTQCLEYAAGKGFNSAEIQQTCIPINMSPTGENVINQISSSVTNIQNPNTKFIRQNMAIAEDVNWYHLEPLLVKGKIHGLLEVFYKKNMEPDSNWYSFIRAIAQQAAIAIDNSTLIKDLEKSNKDIISSYESTLEGWSKALELRDMETKNHSTRVTDLTVEICSRLGMSENELVNVRRGALLHDIGKMGIPDSILLKKGKLTQSDWAIIRKHPQYAYDLLYPIEYLRPALDIPYCHHEKWDGSGYPQGLKGVEIPLAARVFAIIDVWDALLSDRPYRKGWPKEEVIAEIKRISGTHFDPEAVKIFLQVIEEM